MSMCAASRFGHAALDIVVLLFVVVICSVGCQIAMHLPAQATAGNPQILEYHHDAADYYLWPEAAASFRSASAADMSRSP